MIDFMVISTRSTKRGVIEIYPKFIIKKSTDLMIRGGDFYAIWIEERGLWSTDEQDALQLIDRELDRYAEENRQRFNSDIKVLHMWDAESGMIDSWHKYCQKQMRDSFHTLDDKLIFSNTETNKKDYASKKLNYPLEAGDLSAYEKLMSTLYSEEERTKIEWAIGSIVSGESKKLQKFMVLYGAAGTGKSTVLNIIQQLFDGYYSVFDAKALGSSSNSFALEAFKTNPLVAIQHDGDLSRIEDNTRLNSLVSHELMTVNEKFKSTYSNRFKCFLFMGTNKPVKITDAKSGLIRRLIDVSPSGNKLNPKEYKTIVKQVEFELGAIAYHCQEVYSNNPCRYDDYIPITMLGASNDFYNFIIDSYHVFKKENGTTLKAAWEMYKTYCDDAKVGFPFSQRVFKEELKNYFHDFQERFNLDDGTRVRSYYIGFRTEKFEEETVEEKAEVVKPALIQFDSTESIFDDVCSECPAQYASENETPQKKWDSVRTKLSGIDTKKLHYVKVPENHIVIDFDIPDESGNKSFEKNLAEASKWPPTYAELSKSGQGIHLHYIYTGDPTQLSRVYDDHVEVKVFTGKSSLRRMLSKCNNLPTTQLRTQMSLAKDERRALQVATVKCLREKGYSLNEIADKMGFANDSSVRSLLNETSENRMNQAKATADVLRKLIEEKGMIDVGTGVERELGVSKEKLNQALYMLELEGYPIYGGGVPQVTNPGKQTNIKVICPPGTEHKDIYDFENVHSVRDYISYDNGESFRKSFEYPASMDSKRLQIRYADQGGVDKDGVIELRRGVKDLSLGDSHYAQVRIMVDGTHYLKGMAVYSDNMPDGVDVIFNTNKKSGTPTKDVLKKIKDDPDNPFGSLIKEHGGQSYYDDPKGKYTDPVTGKKQSLSLINKRAEEGDWGEWSKTLPSQFLSKQSLTLIKKQLGLREKVPRQSMKMVLCHTKSGDCSCGCHHELKR